MKGKRHSGLIVLNIRVIKPESSQEVCLANTSINSLQLYHKWLAHQNKTYIATFLKRQE